MKRMLACAVALTAFVAVAEKLPITAWGWSFDYRQGEVSPERFREVAEAGFTEILQQVPNDKDAIIKVLDMADAAGLKVLLHFLPTKQNVDAVKNHPALSSYYVYDEPGPKKLKELAQTITEIQSWDPNHPCYVNALGKWEGDGKEGTYGMPDGDYESYLEEFFKNFDWKVVRQDTYPVFSTMRFESRPFRRPRGPLTLFEKWFPTLETVRKVAERHGVPSHGFVLCTSLRNHPCFDNPLPTVAHMKLQAYCNLAYGAQGLEYYEYVRRERDNYTPLDMDLKRTAVFDRCREVNMELHARASCFLGAKVVKVRHAAKMLPELCVQFDANSDLPKFAKNLSVDRHAVVSHLKKGGRDILMVVNVDPNEELTMHLDVMSGTRRVMKDGREVDPMLYNGEYWLLPGDAEVFWCDSGN